MAGNGTEEDISNPRTGPVTERPWQTGWYQFCNQTEVMLAPWLICKMCLTTPLHGSASRQIQAMIQVGPEGTDVLRVPVVYMDGSWVRGSWSCTQSCL